MFVISGDDASIRAEKNLKEFLEAFKDVKFEKHLSTDKLSQELAIKTYPTFLINSVDKFNGVHSAETIRENFCKLNKLPECEKSLSKSLV
jgi:protein-disulfide isomerase-like protein with CxxC motif